MDEILNYIYEITNATINDEKKKEYSKYLYKYTDLITDKNLNKISNNTDNYNIGYTFISKEKDAKASCLSWSDDFVDKYASEDIKKILNFTKNKNIPIENIDKIFNIYNDIKYIEYKNNNNINNTIDDYII